MATFPDEITKAIVRDKKKVQKDPREGGFYKKSFLEPEVDFSKHIGKLKDRNLCTVILEYSRTKTKQMLLQEDVTCLHQKQKAFEACYQEVEKMLVLFH